MNLIHTEVFASKEDVERLKALALRGWSCGDRMMVSSVAEGIQKDEATVEAKEACHQLALSYDLPEIEGLYGISFEGEFVYLEE